MASPDDPLMEDELEALRRVSEGSAEEVLATYKHRLLILGYIEEHANGTRITERGRKRLDGRLWSS